MINVSKQDEQGAKYSVTACRGGDIEQPPPARFWVLQYPLGVGNADLFVEWDSVFNVMMLGTDLTIYGETDGVYRLGRDIQRLCRIEKEDDPSTVPFYHTPLPVYP